MEELRRLDQTEYVSPRRQAGIARLAIHTAFEQSMVEADSGKMTRENAIAHMTAVTPHILRQLGIEVGDAL